MDQTEIVARLSILDLIARYTSIVDSTGPDRIDQLLTLFAPDAEVEFVGRSYLGHCAIRALYTNSAVKRKTVKQVTRHQHSVSSIVINVHGNAATAHSNVAVLTNIGLDHWGRYEDEFALHDTSWLFTRRRTFIDGVVAGGSGAAVTA